MNTHIDAIEINESVPFISMQYQDELIKKGQTQIHFSNILGEKTSKSLNLIDLFFLGGHDFGFELSPDCL